MENHSEKLINIYVNFKDQKTLSVIRKNMAPKTAKREDWRGIIDKILFQT